MLMSEGVSCRPLYVCLVFIWKSQEILEGRSVLSKQCEFSKRQHSWQTLNFAQRKSKEICNSLQDLRHGFAVAIFVSLPMSLSPPFSAFRSA